MSTPDTPKIGIILLCRYDSTRLPGKILKMIQGKPILEYIYERLNTAFAREDIIVATSQEESDNPIVHYCQEHNVCFFRGSKDNVAERFRDCAQQHNFDYAVRITGDSLFVDTRIICQMCQMVPGHHYDFITNIKNRTFPKGISVEIVKTKFYREAYQHFTKPEHFEHVTLYLYQNENAGHRFYFFNNIVPEIKKYNLAIDTPADLQFAESIVSYMTKNHREYFLKDIYQIIQRDQGLSHAA